MHRNKEAKRHRSIERSRIFFCFFLSLCFSASCVFSGCVRVGAGAGYWHTHPDGGTTVKQAGFDTAHLIPGDSTAGKITV